MKRQSRSKLGSKQVSGFWDAIDYVKDSRGYILLAFILFFVSALFGFLFPTQLSFFEKILEDLAHQTEGMGWLQLFIFIFQNNFKGALIALFVGLFFGIVPFLNALMNGALLGYVAARVVPLAGFTGLWRILPHGIFELPAIFIAIGLGIKFGTVFFTPFSGRLVRERFLASLRATVYLILPLLLLAAFIEATLIIFF